MGTTFLASPRELGYTPAEELTFEESRRSAYRVEVAEVVQPICPPRRRLGRLVFVPASAPGSCAGPP